MSGSTVAFVGGTGKLGRGLGLRLAAAGHAVRIGSRSSERAAAAATILRDRLAGDDSPPRLEGMGNVDAIAGAEVVVLTLPFASLETFLADHGALLDDKIVVDVVNPVRMRDGRAELLPVGEGSVGVLVQRRVPGARVVSAFKNAAAGPLLDLTHPAEGDVLIAGDDAGAKSVVAALARAIPMLRPIDAGPLANAAFLEAITALELNLNCIHRAVTSIRILGVD